MKRFKLIKEYPGSKALGTIASTDHEDFFKKYAEFWEEVLPEKVVISDFKLIYNSFVEGKPVWWYNFCSNVNIYDHTNAPRICDLIARDCNREGKEELLFDRSEVIFIVGAYVRHLELHQCPRGESLTPTGYVEAYISEHKKP